MSADELRARFSELAERVVPMEDPHGRLMSRRRKRFRARVASLATVTAAVVVGGVAAPTTMLSFGARPELPPEVTVQPSRVVTAEEYLARLVRAPIRGNLGDDKNMVAEVQKVFNEFEPNFQGLKDPNLVFLNRTDQMLQAVVIYSGGDQPMAVARAANPKASVKELLSDPTGYSSPVTPFLVLPLADSYGKSKAVVGLAPPGCAIDYSAKGGFTTDGTWVRSYEPEPTGDYILRQGRTVNELWRVSCDGKVHEVRPADDYFDSVGADSDATAIYDRVVRYGGFSPSKGGIVQWHGKVAGSRSEMTLVAPQLLPGPAMLAVGPFPKAVLATELPEKMPVPSPSSGRDDWSMIALGIAGEGVTAVRMPQMIGERTFLGDQVLVFTDTDATRVEVLDPQQQMVATAPVNRGVAMLTFSPGFAEVVRTVTSGGKPTSSIRFIEAPAGSRLLGDRLFKDW